MNRNQFITAIIAAIATPLHLFPKNKNIGMSMDKGFKVPAGEGRKHGHIKLKGVNANVLDLKISGSDSNGGIAIFEQTSLSQGKGTPLHVHHFQNEIFYVLEGNYFFKVGDDEFHLSAGDSIFLPQKTPHAWTQVSALGKMEVIFQPAGKMEQFFVTLAALDHEPTKQEMAKIFTDNEMEIVGTPLEIMK
ncbi:cupin domain-containing protein [Flavitalea flava]